MGGKNASLGEMLFELSKYNIRIPEGFAVNADAYRLFIQQNNPEEKLRNTLSKLDQKELSNLTEIEKICRQYIGDGSIPETLQKEIIYAYHSLDGGDLLSVAVRSSATAEDLPTASFAGLHDSFLYRC